MGEYRNKFITKYRNMPVPVKASLWFLICMILQKGITVITTPIFTRLLGETNYGAFSAYSSWEGIIAVFVTMRLSAGVYTQGLVKFERDRKEFMAAMQGLSTFIVVVYFIVYIAFSKEFNKIFELNTYEMISMFVILWTDAIFSFWLCEERVDYRYRKLVIVSLIVSLVKPMAGIFAVIYFKDQVTARVVSIAIVNAICYTPFIIGKFKLKKPFFSKKIWKYALLFNLPLIPHYLSQTVLNKADTLMIKYMIGDGKAGIYNLSYSLAMLLLIVNSAMMQTMTPWMYRKMKERKIKDIKHVAYFALIGIAALNLFLIVFAPEIIKIFAPPTFYEAIWVIPPIAMSGVFIFSYDLFASYEFYYEKTIFLMIASVAGAIINLVLNYIFLPKFGFVAAGYTTLVCYILYAFGHYMFMNMICKKEFDGEKPYDYRVLLAIYGIFMTIGFGIMTTYEHFAVRMSIIGIMVLALVLMRKRIIGFVKELIALRKGQ